MAFENLSDRLQNVFKNLRGKGRLTEADVKEAMKEVKRALLEADVNFRVVKQFVKSVQERAIGEEVLNGLNPAQMVIKIVKEEMETLMGSEMTEIKMKPGADMTVILMAGLQGAGKTTTAAKLAGQFKKKGKRPLLVACDVYRPAAIKQLQVNGEKQGVPVFTIEGCQDPVQIATEAIEKARHDHNNLVIIDTAGRLHVDERMMVELQNIKENVDIYQTVLVVDAMTGQDAVNVAKEFDEQVGIDGVIITKLDGDTRGGAALSIKAVTGKPILYIGMGEKLEDLQQFYPDRMTSRILGMGDVLSLIEKAEQAYSEADAEITMDKIRKADFNFDDYLEQMQQIKKMGGLNDILNMLPGMGQALKGQELDDSLMDKTAVIIYSMTKEERRNPKIINPSRKRRIAKGAGVSIQEVNKLCKNFEQTQKMMKQMSGMMGGKGRRGRRGMFGGGLPGLGGGGFPKFPF
ncbi:MAG: signal recognition particle protein [Lachnospiraceae bacterium]|nr:signal recognition particle protein [Lachnospiraceae bacterium]